MKILTDIDGNKYRTVIIGTQEWMVENLKTTKLNDGTPLNYASIDHIPWKLLSPLNIEQGRFSLWYVYWY